MLLALKIVQIRNAMNSLFLEFKVLCTLNCTIKISVLRLFYSRSFNIFKRYALKYIKIVQYKN
jgi:hypothetical protein